MMTLHYLANSIRALWSKRIAAAALLLFGAGAAPAAATLESLVRAYREAPKPATRAALARFAAAHPKDAQGALARLALGAVAFEQQKYEEALPDLQAAHGRLPRVADYTSFYLAAARLESNDYERVGGILATVRSSPVLSPFGGRALVLEARALSAGGQAAEAARLLRQHYAELPQPDGNLALAGAYEAAGELAQAAGLYQQVYYQFPGADGGERAAAALVSLKERMGAAYPPPLPGLMLERAELLLARRAYPQAKSEYQKLIAELGGAERDHARVGVGAADYLRGYVTAGCRYLRALKPGASEADAQRLYYLVECARSAGNDDEMLDAVKRLERRYPDSPWRLKALVSAGNRFLLINSPERYVPLYKDAAESFPGDPAAAYSHWKVTWHSYLERKSDADDHLRRHLQRFPSHPTAATAMYFLGRLAESQREFGAARAWYTRLVELFPNYYYGTQARERLAQPKVVGAASSARVNEFLARIPLPERQSIDNRPTAVTSARIARARLLRSSGFDDWAESELRFGARSDGQASLLALELARNAGSVHEALRHMKSMGTDYLSLPLDQAPRQFWEFLFPMPYRKDLVRNARQHDLDPFLVAGLIRQESEFNPRAVSRKRAMGLTQVMPATGRQLARRAGLRRFSNGMLFQPAISLKLGTTYLRAMLDQCGGKWEETLAAYNAGKIRRDQWRTWNSFQEPAEFVETIPFTETREYVQAVLRNAAVYRQLYQDRPAEAGRGAPARAEGAGKSGAQSGPARKRSGVG
jgi:soluble lytic murein transglycosylase